MQALKIDTVALYLDYINNFLTVERFAQYYGISVDLANMVIKEGREQNEFLAELKKG